MAGIVELDLPVLRPRIVLTKRGSAIFERSAQSLNLRLLSFDFFAQHLVTDGEGFGGLVFLSNDEATSFISEPSTRISRLISVIARLNSRSPSKPIFKPKLESAMRVTLP